MACEASRVLICDTDALSTGIWHERYLNRSSPEVDASAAANKHDLYLLTGCDIPFIQDGLRDGETIREWMTGRFVWVLGERGLPWITLSGSNEERLRRAIESVDRLLV